MVFFIYVKVSMIVSAVSIVGFANDGIGLILRVVVAVFIHWPKSTPNKNYIDSTL